jgi:hypothetical protein
VPWCEDFVRRKDKKHCYDQLRVIAKAMAAIKKVAGIAMSTARASPLPRHRSGFFLILSNAIMLRTMAAIQHQKKTLRSHRELTEAADAVSKIAAPQMKALNPPTAVQCLGNGSVGTESLAPSSSLFSPWSSAAS